MNKIITDYCQSCQICQERKVSRLAQPTLSEKEVPEVNSFVTLDLIGPLKRTSQGNKWILVCMDYTFKFVILEALPDCSAFTTARIFNDRYLNMVGTPDHVLMDRGTNFTATIAAEFATIKKYKQRFSYTVEHALFA